MRTLKNTTKPFERHAGCLYCGKLMPYRTEAQREALAMHIIRCEQSPLVIALKVTADHVDRLREMITTSNVSYHNAGDQSITLKYPTAEAFQTASAEMDRIWGVKPS